MDEKRNGERKMEKMDFPQRPKQITPKSLIGKTNAGYQILGADYNKDGEIVVFAINWDKVEYVTWKTETGEVYFYGHYSITIKGAIADYLNRLGIE
jgi:hypothetical protein